MNRCLLLWVTVYAAGPLLAQTAPIAKAAGSVTGHVFLADTNGPARLATVVLEPAAPIDGYRPDAKEGVAEHMTSIKTLPDGSFAFPRVPPGAYYVFASAPGYVPPLGALGYSREELDKPTKETKERMAAAVPRVLVQASLPSAVDVTLQRGAAITGTVLYDDGSPASGLGVKLLLRKKDKWVAPEAEPTYTRPEVYTDDRGSFRLNGLSAGEYLLEVDLQLGRTLIDVSSNGMSMSSNDGITVPVYSGGVLRRKDAASFKLGQGEERPGEDIVIPLGKLHGVAGAVTAGSDGHAVNSASVALLYADDKTEAMHTEITGEDAVFAFHFVPEGDYLLRVSDAADKEYTEIANAPGTMPPTHTESRTLHRYDTGEQPVHIAGEMTGVAVPVPEPGKAGKTAPEAQ